MMMVSNQNRNIEVQTRCVIKGSHRDLTHIFSCPFDQQPIVIIDDTCMYETCKRHVRDMKTAFMRFVGDLKKSCWAPPSQNF
jgi:hypothetical protein